MTANLDYTGLVRSYAPRAPKLRFRRFVKTYWVTGACVAAWTLLTWPAHAAEFTYVQMNGGDYAVDLHGEIVEGDAQRLADTVKYIEDNFQKKVMVLGLDSPGGDVAESVKIAQMVDDKAGTAVEAGSVCASACFNILVVGKPRVVSVDAKLGVHSMYDTQAKADDEASKAATVDMVRIYTSYKVPSNVIGKMVTTPPDQVYWLTLEDKRAMFDVVGDTPAPQAAPYVPKPSVVAAPAPSAATAPPQWYMAKSGDNFCVPLESDPIDGVVFHTPQQLMGYFTKSGMQTSVTYDKPGVFGFAITQPGKSDIVIMMVTDLPGCRKAMAKSTPAAPTPAPTPKLSPFKVSIHDTKNNNLEYDFLPANVEALIWNEIAYVKNGQTFAASTPTWHYREAVSGQGFDLVQDSDPRYYLNCANGNATLFIGSKPIGSGKCVSTAATS